MLAPSSSEKRTRIRQQGRRHGMLVAEREHPLGVADLRTETGQHLGRQATHDAMAAPAIVAREQTDRREALLLLTDALERLAPAGRGQQREALELELVVEQVTAEHLAQVRGLAE